MSKPKLSAHVNEKKRNRHKNIHQHQISVVKKPLQRDINSILVLLTKSLIFLHHCIKFSRYATNGFIHSSSFFFFRKRKRERETRIYSVDNKQFLNICIRMCFQVSPPTVSYSDIEMEKLFHAVKLSSEKQFC